jgi:hypothetical protein
MNRTPRPPTAASWPKGKSGNPRGRPKGSGKAAALRDALDEHLPDIIEKLVSLALAGDIQAIKAIVDRRIPPLKAVSMPVTLDMPPGPLSEQGAAVLSALARGALGITEGAQLLGALGAHARAIEVGELAARMARIEKALAERGPGRA